MEKEISEEELKTIVYKSKNNKSPGPDGFSNEFYKKIWTQIRILLLKLMKFYRARGELNKAQTNGIITFIISFTLVLAADWSIAVRYWTVFHCFSLLVNFRMGISVLSSLLKSRLNVLSSFAMVTMVDLKFTGHSLVVFYITRHTKRIKTKIKNFN